MNVGLKIQCNVYGPHTVRLTLFAKESPAGASPGRRAVGIPGGRGGGGGRGGQRGGGCGDVVGGGGGRRAGVLAVGRAVVVL